MAFRPLVQESQRYQRAYASIPGLLLDHHGGVFRLDLLFGADWRNVGNGLERQHFGKRFRADVNREGGPFPYVTVDEEQPYEQGGNEARFIYHPDRRAHPA